MPSDLLGLFAIGATERIKLAVLLCVLAACAAGGAYCSGQGVPEPADSLGTAAWQRGYAYNPTSFGALDVPSRTEIGAGFAFGSSGGLNSPFEGDSGEFFNIYATGYGVRRGKDIFSGTAAFSTGTKRNTAWTDVVDTEILYPYIVSDDTGGDYVSETYRLEGSYSLYAGRNIAGLRVSYKGELAHRGRDPRPKNTASTLTLNPGWTFAVNDMHSVGIFADYTYYKQHVGISVEEESRTYVFYIMRGMGLFDRKFSLGESSFSRYYRSNAFSAGVQWHKKGRHALDATASIGVREVKAEESDNRIAYATNRTMASLDAAYRLTMGRSRLTVRTYGHLQSQDGKERLYERITSDQQTGVQVWKFLSESVRHQTNCVTAGLDAEYAHGMGGGFYLRYGAAGGYYSFEEKFLQPAYGMDFSGITAGVRTGVIKSWGGGKRFSATMSAWHRDNTCASINAPDVADEPGVENMLLPLYEYSIKDFTGARAEAGAEFPVKNLMAGIKTSWDYSWNGAGDRRCEGRIGVYVSL